MYNDSKYRDSVIGFELGIGRIVLLVMLLVMFFVLLSSNVLSQEISESGIPEDIDLANSKINSKVLSDISSNGNSRVIVVTKSAQEIDSLDKIMTVNSNSVTRKSSKVSSSSVSFISNDVGIYSGTIDELQLVELQNNPDVVSVEYDTQVHSFLQNSVSFVNATLVWGVNSSSNNNTGFGQTACIIDTGINYTHVAFGSCTTAEFLLGTCNKVIGGYDFVNSDSDPMDDNGHGTHVAGIISANGSLKGVAPESKLVIIKALDNNGSGYSSDVISGINWCVNNSTLFNISVISLSLGDNSLYEDYCNSDYVSYSNAIDAAIAKNISVVIATGNLGNTNGYSGVSAPACIQNAIRVTATSKSDTFPAFADRGGNFTDVLTAPGASINSTRSGSLSVSGFSCSGTYCIADGTSMATPHVSGAILLLNQYYKYQNNSLLTRSQAFNALNSTGKSIYDSSSSKNYSRINIYSALLSLDQIRPTINISINNTQMAWIDRNVLINWTIADNVLLSNSQINITYPNGSLLFTSSLNTGFVALSSDNLTVAGSYNVNSYAIDSNNNSRQSTSSFGVNLSLSNISLLINNVSSNISVNETKQFNISGMLNLGDSIELIITNTHSSQVILSMLSNSNISLENYTINTSGYYSIMLRHNSTNNYSLSQSTLYVNVTPYRPILNSHTSNSSNIISANNSVINFTVNATDPNNLQIFYYWFINNVLNYTANLTNTLNNGTIQSFAINTSILQSTNSVMLVVSNVDSNNSITWNVNIDTLGPQIGISHPNFANSNLNFSKVDINYTSTDALSNVSSCWYNLINNTQTAMSINSSRNNSLSSCQNTSIYLTNGNFTLTIYANDSYGNVALNSTTFLLNDTTAPLISNPLPSGAQSSGTTSVNLQITTNENATCKYETSDVNYSLMNNSFVDIATDHAATYSVSSGNSYLIYVRCSDMNNNSNSISSNISFSVSASSGTGSSGGGGSGGGSGGSSGGASLGSSNSNSNSVIKTVLSISSGEYSLELNNNNVPVSQIDLGLNSDVKNVKFIVTNIDPSKISSYISQDSKFESEDRVYSYIEINHTNLDETSIDFAKIYFSVNKSWIETSGVNKNNVRLYRYELSTTNNERIWRELETELLNEAGDMMYYASQSPGLSLYAISTKKDVVILNNVSETLNLEMNDTIQENNVSIPVAVSIKDDDSVSKKEVVQMIVIALFSVFILALLLGLILRSKNATKYKEEIISETKKDFPNSDIKSDITLPLDPAYSKKRKHK